jgi:hypothetical protein
MEALDRNLVKSLATVFTYTSVMIIIKSLFFANSFKSYYEQRFFLYGSGCMLIIAAILFLFLYMTREKHKRGRGSCLYE